MLREKYSDIEKQATTLGIKNVSVKEDGGKLTLSGTSTYQLEKDLLWDAIKKHQGWENEINADIAVEKTDIHGIHTVQAGESLSKIAKVHLDNANRYMDIFNANRDKLKDPDLIQPGQQLVIPNR